MSMHDKQMLNFTPDQDPALTMLERFGGVDDERAAMRYYTRSFNKGGASGKDFSLDSSTHPADDSTIGVKEDRSPGNGRATELSEGTGSEALSTRV